MSERPPTAANRLGLDYRTEAARLGAPPVPILDAHVHINGARAAALFREVAGLYGVERFYTQTRLTDAAAVSQLFGDRVRFIAVPNWSDPDRGHAYREGFLEHMRVWRRDWGARIVKFWAAPRLWELVGAAPGDPRDCVPLDSAWRVRAAELAAELGMMFMVHIADPDTWFSAKYNDPAKYGGTKRDQYAALERMLDRFPAPWIAAHMGGWPEDLGFLDDLLTRHANLYLDTSATKWMVREFGRQDPARVRGFLLKWSGRVFFGSDIVTLDDHLKPSTPDPRNPMAHLAADEASAFDLYASRYWAMRTMFETEYDGESPIADPDLKMVAPASYDELSAPTLRGLALPPDALRTLYAGAAGAVIDGWWEAGISAADERG